MDNDKKNLSERRKPKRESISSKARRWSLSGAKLILVFALFAVLAAIIVLVVVHTSKNQMVDLAIPGATPNNYTESPSGTQTDYAESSESPVYTAAISQAPSGLDYDLYLSVGDSHEIIIDIQSRLMELGYMADDEPTIKFGPATEAAVRLFQRQINFTDTIDATLKEDGIAGEQTLALLFAADAPRYVVKYGMEGSDITEMQEQLKDLGYMSAITGYYGDKTVAALRDFQDRNGLSPDGMCGEKTFELLYSDDAKESASKAKSARTKANIDKMISVAKKQLGDKYVLGAKGPDKFDCSGLVYYCLKEAGSNRRRLNAAGYSGVDDWTKITKMSDLKRGDLIFFYDNNFTKIGHVGIVLNSSEMIDASNNRGKVVRRDYTESYWRKHFYCGRRPW